MTDTNNPFDVLTDSDGDGVIDTEDAFPNDPSEQVDTDGDGIGDNADPNPNDAMPLDVDSDGDGIGDKTDPYPNDPNNIPPLYDDGSMDGVTTSETTDTSTDTTTSTTTDTTDTTDTTCLLYTSPSPRDRQKSRMPSSA